MHATCARDGRNNLPNLRWLQEQQFLALFCGGMDLERAERGIERVDVKSHFFPLAFAILTDSMTRDEGASAVIINSRSVLDHRRHAVFRDT